MFTFSWSQKLLLSPPPGIDLQFCLHAPSHSLLFPVACGVCVPVLSARSLGPDSPSALARALLSRPHYAFLFSRQMSSISAASAFQPLPREEFISNSRLLLFSASEKESRQVTAVQGAWDTHQTGNMDTLMTGQMATGTLEFSGTVFYMTISIFTSRKGVFGEDFRPSS